jgi:hypothetical protein
MTEQKRTWRQAQRENDEREREAQWGMPFDSDDQAASPEQMAYSAYQRGDRIFQIDLPVAWVQGWYGVGQTSTRVRHPTPYDVLGAIEAQGWHLEDVSAAFVEQGSSSTKRILANVGSTLVATHGILMGIYVFRRYEMHA